MPRLIMLYDLCLTTLIKAVGQSTCLKFPYWYFVSGLRDVNHTNIRIHDLYFPLTDVNIRSESINPMLNTDDSYYK